jgi:hypothetical protein
MIVARASQFVAGVGDEIGPHPLGRLDCGTVGKLHKRGSVGQRTRAQVPRAFGRAYPDDIYFGLAAKQDHVERKRVTDGEAQVAANDRLAKKRARARLAASVRWARTISAGSAIASNIALARAEISAMARA